MNLYTVKNKDKNGKVLSYRLADDCKIVDGFIKYYLKGVYLESRLIVATDFSVVDLNDIDLNRLRIVYDVFRYELSKLMQRHKPEKFDYACALSEATEEIWEALEDGGMTRMFIRQN